MPEEDLNLRFKISKDEARRENAEFWREIRAEVNADTAATQAAETAKVSAARQAHAQRARDAAAARQAEIEAIIAAEAAKAAVLRSMDAERRAAIRATFNAQREAAAQAAAQIAAQSTASTTLVIANQRQLAAIAQETGRNEIQRFEQTRTAMQVEMAHAEDLGQSWVRIRVVQETVGSSAIKQLTGTTQAAKTTKSALDQNISGVERLGRAFMGLQAFNQIAGMIREAMQAVGQSVSQARDHIKGLVDEMEHARTASRELAALRGEKASGAFTAQLAQEAAGASLDTEEYRQFQLGFQAYTGQYVGKSEATPEELKASGQKLNKEQAEALQQRVASYSVGARGISAEDSSKLLGTVIAKSKAGASNDEIMSEYAKLMKVMELAPGRTSPLIGQLAEVGMESVGPEGDFTNLQQAGYLTRVMAQRNPNEASTYSRAMLRGLRDIGGSDEKRGELGITKDMDVMQQLQQIDIKAQEHVAAGGKEGEFIQKYFPEIREWGAVKTALNEGLRGGGFHRAMAEAASVDSTTADAETRTYAGGREGRASRQRSELLAARRRSAAGYEPLRALQADAAIALAGSHELEIPENMMGAVLTNAGAAFGQGSREIQQINKLTANRLNQGLSGYAEGREYLAQNFGATVNGRKTAGTISGTASENQMAEAARLLERLAKAAEQKREASDRPTPLVAPPQARGGMRH